MRALTQEEFISRSNEIHKYKYNYSKTCYVGSLNYVKVICSIHGEFLIKATNHLNLKQGCFKCGMNVTHLKHRTSVDEFIKKCPKLEEYDYKIEDLKFKNLKEKTIKLTCRLHGEFLITGRDLLRGFGCQQCKFEKNRIPQDEFIKRCKEIHKNRYSYENTIYKTSHESINITCPEHGIFKHVAYIHLAGGGYCPYCLPRISGEEMLLRDFLEENNINFISNYKDFKKIDKNIEFDIYIPSCKLAIEYHGLYWHSERFKDKEYHLNKLKCAELNEIQLIQIFSDEWMEKSTICKSRILNLLKLSSNKIYARKCQIKEIDKNEATRFLTLNHIQGSTGSSFYIALIYKDEIVSLMTFGKYRKSLGKVAVENEFEMVRFCNKINCSVVGAASKLLKFFIKKYHPKKIISYADKRWSSGNLYLKLGFTYVKDTVPNYFYTIGNKRYYRFQFRKSELIKSGHDKDKSEREIMKENNIDRIYDCGSKLYELPINGDDLF